MLHRMIQELIWCRYLAFWIFITLLTQTLSQVSGIYLPLSKIKPQTSLFADLSMGKFVVYSLEGVSNLPPVFDISIDSRSGHLNARKLVDCDEYSENPFYIHVSSIKHTHSLIPILVKRTLPVYRGSYKCNIRLRRPKYTAKPWPETKIYLPTALEEGSEVLNMSDLTPSKFHSGKIHYSLPNDLAVLKALYIDQDGILRLRRPLHGFDLIYPLGITANIHAMIGNNVINTQTIRFYFGLRRLKISLFKSGIIPSIATLNKPQAFSRLPGQDCLSSDILESLGYRDPFDHVVYISQEAKNVASTSELKFKPSRQRRSASSGPYFQQSTFTTKVPENVDTGKTILTITAINPGGKIVYSMSVAGDTRSENLFGIDRLTGTLTVRKQLDRDEGISQHTLVVTATDPATSAYDNAMVLITVLDVNDSPPKFEVPSYTKTVSERAPRGLVLLEVRARDKDAGSNGEVRYSIVNSGGANSAFEMDAYSGSISMVKMLDRETQSEYKLTVKAQDLGEPPKFSTVVVTIIVEDANDNAPQFEKRNYEVVIPEETPPNTIILTVSATDKDEGTNAKITYSMSGSYLSKFSMDPSTGEIRLMTSLDYENPRERSFNLYVRAQDSGQIPQFNSTRVYVTVSDNNDNSPIFLSRDMQVVVPENTPSGKEVYQVQASDRDSGKNGEIYFVVRGFTGALPFSVDPSTGWIKVTGNLNYEQVKKYEFDIVAIDKGKPPKSVSAKMKILISNINDNAPKFEKDRYEVTITEDTDLGRSIAKVSAIDLDQPGSKDLKYSITGGNTRKCFQIDSSGNVYLKCMLNFDQEKIFSLILTVTDKAFSISGRILTGTATMIVRVLDSNTYAPEFLRTLYSASVKENSARGTLVETVSATDSDTGENARISYSIITHQDVFTINATNGEIRTNQELDRETKPYYSLVVVAQDHGKPVQRSQTTVNINVGDVNDNRPIFVVESYHKRILESIDVGDTVLQVVARDRDIGSNGKVEYLFAPGGDGNKTFKIESKSGVIRTSKRLDRETIPEYDLMVIAYDLGTPSLNASVPIKITLIDVKDSPPVFDPKVYNITILENIPLRTVIVRVRATCADIGANARIFYDIRSFSRNRAFRINGATGEIETSDVMDYETKSFYTLEVRARSGVFLDKATVYVHLVDQNDNWPELQTFEVFLNVFNTFPTRPLFRVPATDKDKSDKLSYEIIGGNGLDLVHLDKDTAMLSLKPTIVNTGSVVQIRISVTDGVHKVSNYGYITSTIITPVMVRNSIFIILNDTTMESFLSSSVISQFKKAFADAIGCETKQVYLVGLEPFSKTSKRELQVSVAVKSENGKDYFLVETLKNKLFLNLYKFMKAIGTQVITFDHGYEVFCSKESCSNMKDCVINVDYHGASLLRSSTVIFRGIDPQTKPVCKCPFGYRNKVVGRNVIECAESFSLCYSNPCGSNGKCISTDGNYVCLCKDGFVGRNCEVNLRTSSCLDKICQNDGKCIEKSGVFAGCKCKHADLVDTDTCQLKTRSFVSGSHAAFKGLWQRWKFQISLEFTTELSTAVLLYNGQFNGENDFIAVRISNAQAELVFSLGKDITVVKSHIEGGVSDGKWHKVSVMFEDKIGKIAVGEDCDINFAELVNPDGTTKYCAAAKQDRGTYKSLDLSTPLILGGLKGLSNQVRIAKEDFVGCIRNVYIDHKLLDLHTPLENNGTSAKCPQKVPRYCRPNPCSRGTCTEGYGHYHCICPNGYIGIKCEIDVRESSKLVNLDGVSIISPTDVQRDPPPPWSTSVALKTKQKNSILMHEKIGSMDGYLKIVKGLPAYILGTKLLLNLTSADVSLGNWQHLEVKWEAKSVHLVAEYGRHHVTTEHGLDLSNKRHKLHSIGAVMTGKKIEEGFIGCLQGIYFGDQSISPLSGASKNVRTGCPDGSPCFKSPCGGHGTCVEKFGVATCKCESGYTGPRCIDICTLDPCKNKGKCLKSRHEPSGFRCICPATFTGRLCETEIPTECANGYWGKDKTGVCGPCNCPVHKGFDPNCNKTTGECHCKAKKYRVGDQCMSCGCISYGTFGENCDQVTGQCPCRPGVTGTKCDRCVGPWEELTSSCVEINTSCPKAYAKNIWWNRITPGKTQVEACPRGMIGNATRYCHPKYSWREPNLFECTSNEFNSIRNTLKEIESKKATMNKYTAKGLANTLEFATSTGKPLSGTDIRIGYTVLSQLIEFEGNQSKSGLVSSEDQRFVQNIIKASSRLFGLDTSEIWSSIQTKDSGSSELMQKMEKFVTILADNLAYVKQRRQRRSVTTLPPYNLGSDNILLELLPVNVKDTTLVSLPKSRQHWVKTFKSWKNSKTKVYIPSELFGANPSIVKDNEVTLGFLMYRTLGDLLPDVYDDQSGVNRPYTITVSSEVVTVTIPGLEETTFENAITLEFEHVKNNDTDVKCVFWNYTLQNTRNGGWSTEGCITVPGNNSRVTCKCNHLTSFAVIKLTYLETLKRVYILSPLIYISIAVCMAFLLLAFLTYFCLSELKSNAHSIHKNLCAALLLAQMVFVVGITRTAHETACRIVAIILHYLFSCVFSWMFVEALHMYRMLVERRDINYGQMTFYYFIGWGAPVIFVGVTAGLSPEGYGNRQFCWILTGGQLLWTFTAPILAIVGANSLVFLFALCLSCQKSREVRVRKNAPTIRFTVATSFLLLPVLVASFVIGLLSVNADVQLFHYLFAGFTVLQGTYIILFHVLFNREVQTEYKNAYMRWKTGDKTYGKPKQRDYLKRLYPALPDNSYRSQLAQLTTTFNLDTSTTDGSSSTISRPVGRGGNRKLDNDRIDLSTTQPDSSDTSDDEDTTNPGISETVPSDSSDSSEEETTAPEDKTPDWKVAKEKKLRTAPLYASDGPMHSTPSESDTSDKLNAKRWQRSQQQTQSPVPEIKEISAIGDEQIELNHEDGPHPLKKKLLHNHSSSSGSTSEVSSLPSVISRVGPGGKPQSILKKRSKYGDSRDSDSERRSKVRVRVTDSQKRPLMLLDRDNAEIHDSQV